MNFIPSITLENSRIEGNDNIWKVFSDHFRSQFGSKRGLRFKIEWSKLLVFKQQIDLSQLELLFTLIEIKQATFNLGADKALGLDDFPIFFLQKYWDIVSSEII